MYRYSQQTRHITPNSKLRGRIVFILMVAAVIGCVVLGSLYADAQVYRTHMQQQLEQRIRTNCSEARTAAGKLTDAITSDTSVRLKQVSQAVHTMDQLNQISIALGGERSRIIPAEAIDTLYSILDEYYYLIQVNNSSRADTLMSLVNNLTLLQQVLSAQ